MIPIEIFLNEDQLAVIKKIGYQHTCNTILLANDIIEKTTTKKQTTK
jgi:hypothetical protein